MSDDYEEEKTIEIFENWDAYDLKEEILQGIFDLGFETPSFIQKTAIAPIINGRDIRAQAQSGTGKTAAFGIGALQQLDDSPTSQVLILVSTREMAQQNAARISSLSCHMNVSICVLTGGTSTHKDIENLKQNPQIVVGTPGRVKHMLNIGALSSDFKLCVVDEADEMLGLGFAEQLYSIFEILSPEMQVAMFSATWEQREMEIANNILRQPVVIDLRQDEQTLKGIMQFYVQLGKKNDQQADSVKLSALFDIFQQKNVGQCIIFCSAKSRADYICARLNQKGISAEVIHGNVNAEERNSVLAKFREGSVRLLIATDVLSRGIDIQQLSVVINFDLPISKNAETNSFVLDRSNYIHRIGRAGRFGRKGTALNFVFDEEMKHIKEIENYYRTSIVPLPAKMNLQ